MKTTKDKGTLNRYLIDGNLPLGLWRFALPFMFAYLLQALYGAVDVFIVGRYCDAAAISAVATGAQLLVAITGLILGFAGGGTALIAYTIGADDPKGTAHAMGTCSTLFALAALVFTPVCVFGTNWLVAVLQTPEEALSGARQYVLAISCGIPFIIGYNVVGAIYRGFGDSITPTIFVAVSCVVNVFGDLLLVAHYRLGPLGAALATDAAMALSFFCALVYMRKKRFPFEFHRTHFLPERNATNKILSVGVPLALQDAFTSFSFLIIFAIVNMMGVMASAGMGVAERVIGFMLLPPIAFSNAVTTATAQNYGAKKSGRAFMSFVWGMTFSGVFGFVFLTLCQICPTQISSIFTSDQEVALNSGRYLRSFAIDCVLVAFIFNINGYFCGLGKSMVVFVHSAIAAAFARVPLSYVFSRIPGATLFNVGFAAPLASVVSVVVCVCYLFWLKAVGKEKSPNPEDSDSSSITV